MSEKLSIEALRKDPAYLALANQQKTLVEAYLECGDKVESTLRAYNCQSRESARTMSYAVFGNPRVTAALVAANGGVGTDLESFKREVLSAARNRKLSVAQFNALKLYAQLCGFINDSEPDGESVKAPAEDRAPEPKATPKPEPIPDNGYSF